MDGNSDNQEPPNTSQQQHGGQRRWVNGIRRGVMQETNKLCTDKIEIKKARTQVRKPIWHLWKKLHRLVMLARVTLHLVLQQKLIFVLPPPLHTIAIHPAEFSGGPSSAHNTVAEGGEESGESSEYTGTTSVSDATDVLMRFLNVIFPDAADYVRIGLQRGHRTDVVFEQAVTLYLRDGIRNALLMKDQVLFPGVILQQNVGLIIRDFCSEKASVAGLLAQIRPASLRETGRGDMNVSNEPTS